MTKTTLTAWILIALICLAGCSAAPQDIRADTSAEAASDNSEEIPAEVNSAEPEASEPSEAGLSEDEEETPSETSEPETGSSAESVDQSSSNVLVAYFSATNTTKGVAEAIAAVLGADLFEIVPEEPYTEADLDYNDDSSRTTLEMNDDSVRPAMAAAIDNLDQYDTVFLGYPIWWSQAPRIMNTFVETYSLDGKTIVPFCTSGGSGIGSSAATLEQLAESGTWLEGARLHGNASNDEILEWVQSLGLGSQEDTQNTQ